MAKTTKARKPPAKPSDEADARQLKMAKTEGKAYLASLQYMATKVADTGAKKRAGDYIVGFAQEKAEGMYHYMEGQLHWMEPKETDNCHMEIAVLDGADERFIPYLTIRGKLTARKGGKVVDFTLPFVWHPGLYHYGCNVEVPGSGRYDLDVEIDPPMFMRHDKKNGHRYAGAVSVSFPNVKIKTGRESD